MFEYRRPTRWSELDAAGITFFPNYLALCHEALEALFAPLDGGYPNLTLVRKVGIPTVHVNGDYRAPLRYQDEAVLRVRVRKIGRTSITFAHEILRGDGTVCATFEHVVVVSNLETLRPIPIPPDVLAVVRAHLEPSAT